MSERRYTDDEVAAMFAKAAEGPTPDSPQTPGNDGLTLRDLQEIGREVGIAPEAVTRAADALAAARRPRRLTLRDLQEIGREVGIAPDAVARAAQALAVARRPARRFALGLPISVERTVELKRRLTDDEWERLVVKLRETFDARGAMSGYGSFRQWTNGNLQALLEPTETGQRLRLRTVKGSARRGISTGLAMIGASGAGALAGVLSGHPATAAPGIGLMAAVGIGMLAAGVAPLPRWARLRARQMEAITAGLEAEQSAKD